MIVILTLSADQIEPVASFEDFMEDHLGVEVLVDEVGFLVDLGGTNQTIWVVVWWCQSGTYQN